MQYDVHMTAERAQAAVSALDAVLWFQNERLYQDLRARMPWRHRLRTLGLILAGVGFALALPGVLFAPRLRLAFLAALIAFALFFLLFRWGEGLERTLRRGTRRLVANRARRSLAPALRAAPYTISYAVDGDRLTIRAVGPGLAKGRMQPAEIALPRVRVALSTPELIGLFARPLDQRPLRIIHVPGPEEREQLQETLAAHGAEVVAIEK